MVRLSREPSLAVGFASSSKILAERHGLRLTGSSSSLSASASNHFEINLCCHMAKQVVILFYELITFPHEVYNELGRAAPGPSPKTSRFECPDDRSRVRDHGKSCRATRGVTAGDI